MSNSQGFDSTALQRIRDRISKDIDDGRYDGAAIKVARGGEIALDEAIGYSHRETGRAVRSDDIFMIFSLTKAFTTALTLRAIDLGLLTLLTRVVDVIPEFWGTDMFRSKGKEKLNVGHLLTHRAALPTTPVPLPYDQLHDFEAVIAAICQMDVTGTPGQAFNYSPTLNHALLGEICRRVFGASSIRTLLKEEIFEPLGMHDTSLGVVDFQRERLVPLKSSFPEGGWLTNDDVLSVGRAIEAPGSEMPWVGAATTVDNVFTFAEMLRLRGSLNGKRLLSPAVIEKARQLWTGDAINELYRLLAEPRGWETPPGNMGLGFALGGAGLRISQFGTLTSPETFGNFGAGSTLFWVDPKSDITFACLTANVMEESENMLRFQQLSDLVASAAN